MKENLTQKMTHALKHLQAGGLVIVADSTEREAEGDMVGLAECVTPAAVNLMVTKARGLLCAPLSPEYADRLQLKPMIADSNDAFGTAFTVSLDAKTTSTGISAFDRADTIRQLADPQTSWDDFYHPGHVFPLIAKANGVFDRDGHTEAAVDLAKLAGVAPVAFICEVLKKDGHMARRKDLKALAEGLELPFLTIAEIKAYRQAQEKQPGMNTKVALPTKYGNFSLEAFPTKNPSAPTLLISKGDLQQSEPLLVRLHSECLTGDILGSKRCDCGTQLAVALQKIEQEGRGAVLYLRQEGRGIGLTNKLRAYKLQEQGLDTVEANTHLGFPADARNYEVAAQILKSAGVSQIRLMTNNPDKIIQLEAQGIKVVERVPLETGLAAENKQYLLTKKHKMHHLLSEVN